MRNVSKNKDLIIKEIIKSGDFSENNIKSIIEELPWHKHYTTANSEDEAESIFRERIGDESEADAYFERFGGIHSNKTEVLMLEIEEGEETHHFKVTITEYYVASGVNQEDYIFNVDVDQIC